MLNAFEQVEKGWLNREQVRFLIESQRRTGTVILSGFLNSTFSNAFILPLFFEYPPGWRCFFILVIGQYTHIGAIGTYYTYFTVRLRVIGVQSGFIFKALDPAAESDPCPIRRPNAVRFITRVGSNSFQICPIGLDSEKIIVAFSFTSESNQIAVRRPNWEIIVSIGGERGDFSGFDFNYK